ncbi:hypothetical protein BMS3Abin08_01693 [bacterium BMS3Abin08]|nr:hypothetical protein BMS3Abin08_01693 [bacterium BMS3Abin08]
MNFDFFIPLIHERFQDRREVQPELRPTNLFGTDLDTAPMALDNGIDYGQPKSGPPPGLLCGKEGIKNPVPYFLGYSRTCINDRQADIIRSHLPGIFSFSPPAGNTEDTPVMITVALGSVSFYRNFTALGHFIPCIHYEVQEHLVELSLIGLNQVDIVAQLR